MRAALLLCILLGCNAAPVPAPDPATASGAGGGCALGSWRCCRGDEARFTQDGTLSCPRLRDLRADGGPA
jgi:hypothetical protein